MEHLELFLNTRSLVDKWPQTPHLTRAQQASPPPFSASTTPVIDKQQERPFLAASPATPRSSLKRPRSRSNASSSSIICNSSSPAKRPTPSSSPQSCQSLVLESSDRPKRLRIDDTIVVEPTKKKTRASIDLRIWTIRIREIRTRTTLDLIIYSADYNQSQNCRRSLSCFRTKWTPCQKKTNLRTIDERDVLGFDNLHGNYTSQNERVKSLERARETQSDVLSKTEGSLAKIEAKLIAAEERISKEVSNMRIDKQSQNLDASAGKSGSYEKIKTRCRKVEERLKTLDQRTTAERSLYRLLDSNTKYTRELNHGVNTWKKQCDKEYSEAKLLGEQVQTLEQRSSAMEKMIRDQQGLIEELASQLRLQQGSKIPEASIGDF
ncbi:hypothetical protein F5882DRAFT_477129 [Hyaloscypha sp. PMI_1271]|nr:hypothetical protein F5882DRAFT_477129 [Hyaloscypha sp. PMI_1271]